MNNKLNLAIISFLLMLTSCTSVSIYRDPSSLLVLKESQKKEELFVLKQRKVELTALSAHFQKKKNENQLKKIQNEQKNIEKKINKIESNLTEISSNDVNKKS